jgi:uncharacterized protein YjiS (DUF1127 family)
MTSLNQTHSHPGLHAAVGTWLAHVVDNVAAWHTRVLERRDLASLSDNALHDLALTRADVEHEYDKPFWRG